MNERSHNVRETALAVARHIETLLPPLSAVTSDLDPADLGPVASIPAVYVRIVTSALKAEVLSRDNEAMQAKLDRASRKPKAPITDEAATELAIHLASEAIDLSHDPLEGVAALWRASAIIAVSRLPGGGLLRDFDAVYAAIREDVAEAIGARSTKQ
nr:hypothetical protein [Novosphingobium panipatense]